MNSQQEKKKRELKSVSRFEPRYWKYAFVSNVRDPQPGGQLRELSAVGFHSYSTLFPFLVIFHSHRNPNGVTSPRWPRGFASRWWVSGDMKEISGFSLSLRLRTRRERRESCWERRREKMKKKNNSNGHFYSFLVLLFLLTFFWTLNLIEWQEIPKSRDSKRNRILIISQWHNCSRWERMKRERKKKKKNYSNGRSPFCPLHLPKSTSSFLSLC